MTTKNKIIKACAGLTLLGLIPVMGATSASAASTFTTTGVTVSYSGTTAALGTIISANPAKVVERAGVCIWNAANQRMDALNVDPSISATGTTLNFTKTLTAGNYQVQSCVRDSGGVWKFLGTKTTFVASSTPATSMPPFGTSSDWTSTFRDEFNTDSIVDSSKWLDHRFDWDDPCDEPFNQSIEDAAFKPENVSVSGGSAILTMKTESCSIWGNSYNHTSGMITSGGKWAVNNGDYVEARIYIPEGDGLWPAFWMVPQDGTWPPEIDGFEFFGTDGQSQPAFNYHLTGGGQTGPDIYGATGVDYRDSWHTYGVYRAANGTITPYVDGIAYSSVTATSGTTAALDLIINLSAYDNTSPINGTQMKIDYVRSWHHS